ncbi:PC4 and SFRS1-interacting protein-like [Poecilia reticulata]|uniref:PC4 and SFRS1-interacting protein-like n=1 Tax=Poecilia reticulata TaxID=8081 RepID=UPI0007EB297E|nr:PREDICTED: PC4 and SFRS1-interacting protein-like [Poecilia reticulata]
MRLTREQRKKRDGESQEKKKERTRSCRLEESKQQKKNKEEKKSGADQVQAAAESLQIESAAKDAAPDEKEVTEREVTERESPTGTDQGQQKKNSSSTLTDSTLHRINGDLRISLKTDKPDIRKCLSALDQLSMLYVTSEHVQRHSELIATLRKMRYYRANQAIMDKASMLYNRFKNAFLAADGEEVVSAAFLRSLLQDKEEAQLVREKEEASEGEEEKLEAKAPVDSS